MSNEGAMKPCMEGKGFLRPPSGSAEGDEIFRHQRARTSRSNTS